MHRTDDEGLVLIHAVLCPDFSADRSLPALQAVLIRALSELQKH